MTGLWVFILVLLIPMAFVFWFGWALISFVTARNFGQTCKYFAHSVASVVLVAVYELYIAFPLLEKLQ